MPPTVPYVPVSMGRLQPIMQTLYPAERGSRVYKGQMATDRNVLSSCKVS